MKFETLITIPLFLGTMGGVGYVIAENVRTDPGSLDRAQQRFEGDMNKGRGYNWPWFHQKRFGMRLECFDYAESLRVCTVVLPTVDPIDGKPGVSQRETFACSRFVCEWAVLE